jgi:hypothetical protein
MAGAASLISAFGVMPFGRACAEQPSPLSSAQARGPLHDPVLRSCLSSSRSRASARHHSTVELRPDGEWSRDEARGGSCALEIASLTPRRTVSTGLGQRLGTKFAAAPQPKRKTVTVQLVRGT